VVLDNNKTIYNNLKETDMKKAKTIITISSVFIFLFSYGNISGNTDHSGGSDSDQTSSKSTQTETKSTQTKTSSTQTSSKPAQTKTTSTQTNPKPAQTKTTSTQTTTKSTQTKTKSTQTSSKSTQTKAKSAKTSPKSEPAKKPIDTESVLIGTQSWAIANLNVITFRNGDTIPEAKTNKEWETAGASGKPAWCYYNNDPANGPKYGKLYNWYALNDPRGLAPVGWVLSTDADWAQLTYYLGGQEVAGKKMKSTGSWIDGNNGTNDTGFKGLPGGYRVENGTFLNLGSIGTWWSSTESKSLSAIDHYLALSGSLGRSSSPKQRGESVRCLRN
jgi:uncharacterized protein (TIGR02145 family)